MDVALWPFLELDWKNLRASILRAPQLTYDANKPQAFEVLYRCPLWLCPLGLFDNWQQNTYQQWVGQRREEGLNNT